MKTTKPRNRAILLVFSILALQLAVGFTVSDGVFRWYWTDVPWVAAVLVVFAIVLGVGHFVLRANRAS